MRFGNSSCDESSCVVVGSDSRSSAMATRFYTPNVRRVSVLVDEYLPNEFKG
jgi:hypothetical protein